MLHSYSAGNTTNRGIFWMFVAGLCAISMLLAKRLTEDSDPLAIVAGLSLVCTATLLVPALMSWVMPNTVEVLLLSLTAVFATMGHYTMTLAFKYAPLTALQPISFLQLVWATVAGIVLFSEAVDFYVVLGGAVLVISASYIAHQEAQVNRQHLKRQMAVSQEL